MAMSDNTTGCGLPYYCAGCDRGLDRGDTFEWDGHSLADIEPYCEECETPTAAYKRRHGEDARIPR